MYRWVPFNPNVDNPNPCRSLMCTLYSKIAKIPRNVAWFFFFELSLRHLYSLFLDTVTDLFCSSLQSTWFNVPVTLGTDVAVSAGALALLVDHAKEIVAKD